MGPWTNERQDELRASRDRGTAPPMAPLSLGDEQQRPRPRREAATTDRADGRREAYRRAGIPDQPQTMLDLPVIGAVMAWVGLMALAVREALKHFGWAG